MCRPARSPPNGVVELNVNQLGNQYFRAAFPFKSGQIFRFYSCQYVSRWPNERSISRSVFHFVRFHGFKIHRLLHLWPACGLVHRLETALSCSLLLSRSERLSSRA